MNNQSKQVYISLMNRIATVLMVNQAALLLLSGLFQLLEALCVKKFGDTQWVDMTFRLCECFTYIAGFTLPVMLFNKMNKNAPREIYEPQDNGKRPSVIGSILMLGVGLGMTNLSAYLNYYLVEAFIDYADFSQEYLWSVEIDRLYQILIYFVYSAVIPAVVEEVFFRGTICRALGAYGKSTAVLVSAAAFALMHANIEQLLYAFIAGLFLGWIYVETRSLLFPILLHFINNGISAALEIINEHCAPSVYNLFTFISDIAVLGISAAGLIYFLVRIYKGEKLFVSLKLKPDENGNEVAPLTVAERIMGFFSVGMIIFILYSILTMASYIYLSTQL